MGDPAPEPININEIRNIGTEPFLQIGTTTVKDRSVRVEGPPKRLIICCDGSWQSSNHGQMNIPSNVARLSRAIARCGLADDKGDAVHQIVYYNAGVGTGTSKKDDQNWLANTMAGIQKTWEGAFGRGLEENVCEGYNFLVNNWSPGDEIYIFGFSRGAYTARALAGLVCNMGICMPDMMDDWWAMYDDYKKRLNRQDKFSLVCNTHKISGQWIDTWSGGSKGATAGLKYEDRFYKNVPIEVVGVFDTVGALGLPNNTWFDFTSYNSTEHGFHDTDVHPQIKHAFHALALDDHRAPFSPTLWHLPTRNTTTKLIQCWFPGCHIHIGGGSEETAHHVGDLESMASLSLAWMIDRVREHTNLQFESYELTRLYQTYTNTILDLSQRSFKRWDKAHSYSYAKGDGKTHDDEADPDNRTGYGGWGMGFRPDSMTFGMSFAGTINRTPGQYKPLRKNDKNELVALNPDLYSTEEYIHPVVAYALGKPYREANQGPVLRYQPEALKNFTRVKDPKDPTTGKIQEGIFWRGVFPPPEKGFLRSKWDSFRGGSQPPVEPEVLLIPEMPLWKDTDNNLLNERDYMRADWLAFLAPRLGFPEPTIDHIDKFLEKDKASKTLIENLTERETDLLYHLAVKAQSQLTSVWQMRSVAYKLRQKIPSKGNEGNVKLMLDTGARTRDFLALLDQGELYPEEGA
ncbi:hypothetical protein BO99DRAFT_432589 [Aspergillus violaceofuscus CBS 115571]|uniref:T6SS Phospholipase effector Tle1-like catalytic domain-containing protein n=1 Tax=Aspergillus violaceofuscus (strain CBS 115571) TaxID=1450538 RepID=A0A2V5H5K6_ASPV1|nr:hypothetical protein BO99DRAFT_432589 [Aspergillus violaceofuscus CBS 115571]